MFGFTLRVASPPGFEPDAGLVTAGGSSVQMCATPRQAVDGADLVVTDTWTSMGQEAEKQRRLQAFSGYRVDNALMLRARPDAVFMHCLPAHRCEEVTAEVIDGPQSVVWDEAENRLWAQMALLEFLWNLLPDDAAV
jgi:ornithine carbamoyltransferase